MYSNESVKGKSVARSDGKGEVGEVNIDLLLITPVLTLISHSRQNHLAKKLRKT